MMSIMGTRGRKPKADVPDIWAFRTTQKPVIAKLDALTDYLNIRYARPAGLDPYARNDAVLFAVDELYRRLDDDGLLL